MAVMFLLYFGFLLRSCMSNLATEYDHQAILDKENKTFRFSWSLDRDNETINFAVEVETAGWIGLGFSQRNGKMKGSDVVVGWVKDDKGYLTDRYADDYSVPVLDKHQSYELTGFSENDGKTILKFKRKLDTCDDQDMKLENGPVIIIYAYSYEDPESMVELKKHVFKGQRTLHLLNTYKGFAPSKDIKYFDVKNKQVRIPSKPTTYWCQPIKLPQFKKKQHIVKIAPLVNNGHKGLLHHMVIYICDDDFDENALNQAGDCFHPGLPKAIDKCGLRPVLMAWAMGMKEFVYPEHVGFSVGTNSDPKILLLSTHFNNPDNGTDYVDNSGMRFYYDEPRQYDSGILMAGCMVKNSIIIPPGQKEWVVRCYCPKQCTKEGLSNSRFKEGGINVFAVALHAHSAGRRMRTRHLRNGKELPDIVHNNNFDVKKQEILYLEKEERILPGDDIISECVYNTMDRKEITKGGHGARDEMCLNFIMYYPRSELTLCLMETEFAGQWLKEYIEEEHNKSKPVWSMSKTQEFKIKNEMADTRIKTNCMGRTGLKIESVSMPRITPLSEKTGIYKKEEQRK